MDYTRENYVKTYAKLRQLATLGETIGYQQVSNEIGLGMNMHLTNDRRRIGQLLGDISTAEHNAGRPMRSTVVVYVDEKPLNPGPGFFECARRLGRLLATDHDTAFFQHELEALYAYWAV